MADKIRIESLMNSMVMTLSQGEFNTKPGSVIISKYYYGLKQQWMMSNRNGLFCIHNVSNNSLVLDVEKEDLSIYADVICYKMHFKENQLWKIKKFIFHSDNSKQINTLSGEKKPTQSKSVQAYYIQNVKSGLVL